jgi:hypothetical protein
MTGAAFNIMQSGETSRRYARCKLSSISVEMGQGGDRTPRQGARKVFLFPLVHTKMMRAQEKIHTHNTENRERALSALLNLERTPEWRAAK